VESEGIAASVAKAGRVIVGIYSTPQPGQAGVAHTSIDTSAMKANSGAILENILDTAGEKTAVLAMGSPYPILSYPQIRTYLCAFSSVSTSERAAARALFGEIPIHGKLPVTLPDTAKRGFGIDMPASAPAR
jgi:beta-N-acetylhexosaminidase